MQRKPGIDVSRALTTLRLFPALLGGRSLQALQDLLFSNSLGIRNKAAELLALHADPLLGARHIVYNAMWQHPLLGRDNAGASSGWTSAYLLRFSRLLNRELCDLLVADQERLDSPIHAEAIAAARDAVSFDELQQSFDGASEVQGATLAFVAAYRGIEGGAELVSRISRRFPILCMTACALACRYKWPASKAIRGTAADCERNLLSIGRLSEAETTIYLALARGVEPADLFRSVFFAEVPLPGRVEKDQKVVSMFRWRSPRSAVFGADYLWNFASAEDREKFLKVQAGGARTLVELDAGNGLARAGSWGDFLQWEVISPGRNPTEFLLPGVSVEFEKSDIVSAATGWMEDPQMHQVGLLEGGRRSRRL